MNITEVAKQHGIELAYPADWLRHPNGGGWRHKTAQVAATAFLAETAMVLARAIIGDFTYVGHRTRIYYIVEIARRVNIGCDVTLGNYVRIGEQAKVKDCTKLGYGVSICGGASVEGEWITSPICITGLPYLVFQPKPGYIQVGCRRATYEWWSTEAARNFARKNCVTPDEVKKYKWAIDGIKAHGVAAKKGKKK